MVAGSTHAVRRNSRMPLVDMPGRARWWYAEDIDIIIGSVALPWTACSASYDY